MSEIETELIDRMILVKKIEQLSAELAERYEQINSLIAKVTELRCKAFKAQPGEDDWLDAARYRYMRSSAVFQDRSGPGLYWHLPRLNKELPVVKRLDSAIDELMNNGDL